MAEENWGVDSRCIKCGYLLIAPEGLTKCPECGTGVTITKLAIRGGMRYAFRPLWRQLLLAVVVFNIAVLLIFGGLTAPFVEPKGWMETWQIRKIAAWSYLFTILAAVLLVYRVAQLTIRYERLGIARSVVAAYWLVFLLDIGAIASLPVARMVASAG